MSKAPRNKPAAAPTAKRRHIAVCVPTAFVDRLNQILLVQRRSVSNYVRNAIEDALIRDEKQPPPK